MSDRSFVRFGGLAAILLAVTSWLGAIAYYALGRSGQDEVGMEMVAILAALAAFWSLFAIVAVHWTMRAHGEAWSFFAVLIGIAGAAASMAADLYPVAFTRAVLARPLDAASPLPVAVAATDPLNVMSVGLAAIWFAIVALLLWRGAKRRRLAFLGACATAVLLFGFLGGLSAQPSTMTLAVAVGGWIVAPLFWLWMGLLLRRA